MKKVNLIIILFFTLRLSGQYTVEAQFEEYSQIENYNSIAIESLGQFYWAKKFDLPFVFPYFDTSVNSFTITHDGVGGIEGEVDYSMRLMAFLYMYDSVLDTVNLESDVRYKYGVKDGKDYLVIQFTKNRLAGDPSIDEFDSNVNFQYWFFADGTIEIRFGFSNLDNSPLYVPGEGFFILTDQGPIPAGPQLALYHPYDENIQLEYNDLDNFMEYELNNNGVGSVDWWPPEDWVIRFTNDLVSSNDIDIKSTVNIYPNPSSYEIHIDSDSPIKKVVLFTADGKVISSTSNSVLNIANLKKSLYFITLQTEKSISNHKIIKL